jgi:hypothetical protein
MHTHFLTGWFMHSKFLGGGGAGLNMEGLMMKVVLLADSDSGLGGSN